VGQAAVIVLDFDPNLRLGGLTLQLQSLGLAIAILLAIVLLARLVMVERSRAALPGAAFPLSEMGDLRLDDLLFLLLGAVPGAVIGGRLGSVLVHADYYRAFPGAIVDPGFGGLTLSLAVVGGLLSATYVGRLLGVPVGAWAHLATLPVLFVLAAGKLAMAFGGSGQGLPSDVAWATAYAGGGPWGSLGPEVPAHPAQLYEAAATGVVIVFMGVALYGRAFSRRNGAALLVGLALWAVARAAVATTWRDATVLGPLRAEQLVALGIALGAAVLALIVDRRGRRGTTTAPAEAPPSLTTETEPQWPDPATRPRF
jgi:prolipoprotein diacylglyceryltransferase